MSAPRDPLAECLTELRALLGSLDRLAAGTPLEDSGLITGLENAAQAIEAACYPGGVPVESAAEPLSRKAWDYRRKMQAALDALSAQGIDAEEAHAFSLCLAAEQHIAEDGPDAVGSTVSDVLDCWSEGLFESLFEATEGIAAAAFKEDGR